VSLDQIVLYRSWSIYRAVKSEKWPNDASLEIAKLWLHRDEWKGPVVLDNLPVKHISTSLRAVASDRPAPHALEVNAGIAHKGTETMGLGFLISPEQASDLIQQDARNAEVVKPYLNGDDLYGPTPKASRWVLDFGELSTDEAARFAGPWRIAEEQVLPERLAKDGKKYPKLWSHWWQFWRRRADLYEALRTQDIAFALVRHTPYPVPVFTDPRAVYSDALIIFSSDSQRLFAILSSSIHQIWVSERCSTLGGQTNLRYTPSDVFLTFPFPQEPIRSTAPTVADRGLALASLRAELMKGRNIGLSELYGRVHNNLRIETELERLRQLQIELDLAVLEAYGWSDLVLDHCHCETAQGRRFTVSPAAKDELLDRLFKLNHEQYAAELHDTKGEGSRSERLGRAAGSAQESLL
ncbi:MAG: type IIL restriction-modification enzyme MmeI, partial [Chloroflexota bacterium]